MKIELTQVVGASLLAKALDFCFASKLAPTLGMPETVDFQQPVNFLPKYFNLLILLTGAIKYIQAYRAAGGDNCA